MKQLFIAAISLLALSGGGAVGQGLPNLPDGVQPRHAYKPATRMVEEPHALARRGTSIVSTVTPLPSWDYSITASADRGGGVYSGTILGRSPYLRGKTTTTIPTQIVPLIITITTPTSSVTYDPTAPDACLGGVSALDKLGNSPIFTNNSWTMNGVNVGNTQYIDAFQRAQFWSLVGGTPYHLMLNKSNLPAQPLSFAMNGVNGGNFTFTGGCEPLGIVQIDDLDAAVQALITGPLAGMVNAGTFPVFLTKSVVSADGVPALPNHCCILGYHSGLFVGGNLQVYSPLTYDASGAFGDTDISVMAHEMGEAVNDPTGINPTPAWGNIGQTVGFCQANFEVGDPLSPGFGTPTNSFVVGGYHLQEMAFFNWFFGGPSLGAGGAYSNNGTFLGDAKHCPPGGTN